MSQCLDENTALGLLEGRLSSSSRNVLERHLEGCDACRELVAELAKGGIEPVPPTQDLTPDTERTPLAGEGSTLPPSSRVGPYRVERAVGSGSAGTVYRAIDARTNHVVALKLVHDSGMWARFMREAQTLARLEHDAIVRYVGHGETPSGMYLAMEWLEGEDLSARLKRGPLGWEGARTVGLRLAAALAHAHGLGCVHRDLSPRNVFLPGGRLEAAKLLDFGLVRVKDTQLARTATNAVLGTPYYMSPEQVRDPKSVTPSSDLFGLGVLLYEGISGVRPFDADDLFTLWARIVDATPPDLRTVTRGHVPEGLVQLVDALLAKDPARRPASAAEVHARLTTLPTLHASSSSPAVVPVLPSAPPVPLPGVFPSAVSSTAPRGGAAPLFAIGIGVVSLLAVGVALAYPRLARFRGSKVPSASASEPSSEDDAPRRPRGFPVACATNEELELTGDWEGTGPIVTSAGPNCTLHVKNARLKGSTFVATNASGIDLDLQNVTIETTDTAVRAGANLTVRMRDSSIVSARTVFDADTNLELPEVVGSTIESKGGTAVKSKQTLVLNAERTKILAKDAAIECTAVSEITLGGDTQIRSSTGPAIQGGPNLKVQAEGGRIEGVAGIVATSNPNVRARRLVLSGSERPALSATTGLSLDAIGGEISSRGGAAVEIEQGELTLNDVRVQGVRSGISAQNGLVLRASNKTRIAATGGQAVVMTSNGDLKVDDATLEGSLEAIKGTVNARIKLEPKARVAGGRGGISVEQNLWIDTNGATVDGGTGAGLFALSGARITFRQGLLKGAPALRLDGRPVSVDLGSANVEGGRKIPGR